MSSLQNKMNNYEVVPPASVWDRVAAALDESASGQEFPNKLYHAEVAPPAAAWDHIEAALHPGETKVIPLRKRAIPAFVRYVAAAILIGAVAFGVLQITGSSPGDNLAGNNTDTSSLKNGKKTNNLPQQGNLTSPKEGDMLLAQVEPVTKPLTPKTHTAAISNALYGNLAATDQYDLYEDPLYQYEPIPNPADRYIMFMTPEGNIIRMSKKLGDLVCCVSGEEQDEDCKSQIKKWQEKLATSPAASSPGNFLDILTLLNSLDENTGIEL